MESRSVLVFSPRTGFSQKRNEGERIMGYEVGKFYKTRDGRKAQIFMLDNGNGMMLGCVHMCETWSPCMWRSEGDCLADEITRSDLIGEWRDPVKYSVELYGNTWKPNTPEKNISLSERVFGNDHAWCECSTEGSRIKYRITVEEIPNDL
jgi:hypothetical protein